jgi:hypothetical protein
VQILASGPFPSLNGNNRTGFMLADSFLDCNGLESAVASGSRVFFQAVRGCVNEFHSVFTRTSALPNPSAPAVTFRLPARPRWPRIIAKPRPLKAFLSGD